MLKGGLMRMFFPGSPMNHRGGELKNIGIVTTASLPWLTGASIMPLLHAVYLKKCGFKTTLYVPWLPPDKQMRCFQGTPMPHPEAQYGYIKRWLSDQLRPYMPDLCFFPGRYSTRLRSIATLRDPARFVRPADAILLEGPEHLFFCHPFSQFRKIHRKVVGIIITNYAYFHSKVIPAPLVRLVQKYFRFLITRMCHDVISIAVPVRKDICFHADCRVVPLNAALPEFFRPPPDNREDRCYFMGKLLPEKGLAEMFRGLQAAGIGKVDLFGDGDRAWVRRTALRFGVYPVFMGNSQRPWEILSSYRTFVNCSRSEYLCTTTANALAMRQWVILPVHPSNEFYYQFRNCLTYASPEELLLRFDHARTHEPEFDPKIFELSWDAAIQRMVKIVLG